MSIQDNFRLAMRRYVYSVSILSNKDSDGNSNAITVSSVTSISMDLQAYWFASIKTLEFIIA